MTAELKMKAVRFHKFGGPEVLIYEDAPRPQIAAGEVLVRVRAVGVNPPDWYLREGYKMLPPEWRPPVTFPAIPGTDISGVVEAVSSEDRGFRVGDEVYSMVKFPEGSAGESRAYAEYVAVPASQLAHKPTALNHQHAAGVPMSLLTAWQFLIGVGHTEPNPLQAEPHRPVPLAGKTVLVNGAAGGTGHFALQLAKWKGARVIAVASARHDAMLRDLGADEIIDYHKRKPEDVVSDVDLVVDTVGGAGSEKFLKIIKRGGALYPIFPLGFNGSDEAQRLGVYVSTTQVRSNGQQLEEIARLLDAGTLRVVLDSSFPLAEAKQAHERAAEGHIQGKIILIVDEQQ